MISYFFYVCQSIFCLVSSLKIGQLLILLDLDEPSFSNFLDIFLGCLYISFLQFHIFVCLSVCSLPHFLTKKRLSLIPLVLDEPSFSNFLEIFLQCTIVSNILRFCICVSVCSLPHFFTDIRVSVISPDLDEQSF